MEANIKISIRDAHVAGTANRRGAESLLARDRRAQYEAHDSLCQRAASA